MNEKPLIHFIAPSDKSRWHALWEPCLASWQKHFKSEYTIKIWNDDEEISAFIAEHYSRYYDAFIQFPEHIMRIDFVRLAILHYYGGVYADLDVYCYRDFLSGNKEIASHDLWFVENGFNEFITGFIPFENCLMIANRKNNSFFIDAMETCVTQFNNLSHLFNKESVDKDWLVNQITGSNLLLQSRDIFNSNQFKLLDFTVFNNRPGSFADFYAVKHMHSGVWGKDKSFKSGASCFRIDDKGRFYLSIDGESLANFDFNHDYTNGNFFRKDRSNLTSLKRHLTENG